MQAFFAGTPVISSISGIANNYEMNVLLSSTPGYDYANAYVVLPTGTYRSTQTATTFVPLDILLTPPIDGLLYINTPVEVTAPSYFVFQFSTWPNGGNGRTPAVAVGCYNSNLGDYTNFVTVTGIYLTDNFLGCLAEIIANQQAYASVDIDVLNHCNFCQYSTQNCGRSTNIPNITCVSAFLGEPTTTPPPTTTITTTTPITTTTGTGTTTTAPPTTPPVPVRAIISSIVQTTLPPQQPYITVNISQSTINSTALYGQLLFSTTGKTSQAYSDQTPTPNTGVAMPILLSNGGLLTFGVNGSVSPYPPPQSQFVLQSFPTTNAFVFFVTNSTNFAYTRVVASSYACQRLQDNQYSYITSFSNTSSDTSYLFDFCINLLPWAGSSAIPYRSRFICPYCVYVFQSCNGTSTSQCGLQFSQANPYPLLAGARQHIVGITAFIELDFSPTPIIGYDTFVGSKITIYENQQNITQQSYSAPDVAPYITLQTLLANNIPPVSNITSIYFIGSVNITDLLATLPQSTVFSMKFYAVQGAITPYAMSLLCYNNYTSSFTSVYAYTSTTDTSTILQCFANYASSFPGASFNDICANCNTLVI